MGRCFVTRSLPGGAVGRLEAEHEVDLWRGSDPPSRPELLERVAAADGLLAMLSERVDRELLDAAPRLRAVANYAVGTDNLDLAALTERGIPAGNTPDVLTETTADLAFALLLAGARRVAEGDRAVRAGQWPPWSPTTLLGGDVHGAVLGVIGYGRIGRAVARRAAGFSMEVIHTGRTDGVALDDLLARSDFVTIHCPLTPETRGLIGAQELRRMRATAVLVNTARGEIVDTAALELALRERWIAAAAIDVTDPEPLPPGHPLLDAANLTVTPHIGSASRATRAAMADVAVDNLLAALAGERMPSCANPEVYVTRRAP